MHALTNTQIYTSETILTNHAVIVEAGVIKAVLPDNQLPADIQLIDLEGNDLVPGFIDFQVYGGDIGFFVKDLSSELLPCDKTTLVEPDATESEGATLSVLFVLPPIIVLIRLYIKNVDGLSFLLGTFVGVCASGVLFVV